RDSHAGGPACASAAGLRPNPKTARQVRPPASLQPACAKVRPTSSFPPQLAWSRDPHMDAPAARLGAPRPLCEPVQLVAGLAGDPELAEVQSRARRIEAEATLGRSEAGADQLGDRAFALHPLAPIGIVVSAAAHLAHQ